MSYPGGYGDSPAEDEEISLNQNIIRGSGSQSRERACDGCRRSWEPFYANNKLCVWCVRPRDMPQSHPSKLHTHSLASWLRLLARTVAEPQSAHLISLPPAGSPRASFSSLALFCSPVRSVNQHPCSPPAYSLLSLGTDVVKPTQFGLLQNGWSGSVNTESVYGAGRYFVWLRK